MSSPITKMTTPIKDKKVPDILKESTIASTKPNKVSSKPHIISVSIEVSLKKLEKRLIL